jgi:hypothetical protein
MVHHACVGIHRAIVGQRVGLLSSGFSLALSALTPAYDGACHDRQSSPTDSSPYHLAEDWHDVEAPQSWDHEL